MSSSNGWSNDDLRELERIAKARCAASSPDLVDDVVQTVLEKVLGRPRASVANLAAFARTLADNAIKDEWRKRRREAPSDDVENCSSTPPQRI